MEYDIVPNSEIVISRTAFKDNSSYYELNKKKVQFKEIAKILRFYGVDLDHNRFLILQVCILLYLIMLMPYNFILFYKYYINIMYNIREKWNK